MFGVRQYYVCRRTVRHHWNEPALGVFKGWPVASRKSDPSATANWLKRGMKSHDFQAAMRSGHFPIVTNEAFQVLLARLEQAEIERFTSIIAANIILSGIEWFT